MVLLSLPTAAMDFNDSNQLKVFFDAHQDLPRQGPGNRASTERALDLAGDLPEAPRILDIGCGPGVQTLDLARARPDARITAVDLHEPFLAEASRRVAAAGAADRVTFERADMAALRYPDASFDLIWCEGAAYILGVEHALIQWQRLLRPAGVIALTDAVWLVADPPEPLNGWWRSNYPDMASIAERRALVKECGYRLLGDFVLPESAWWEPYYTPMETRLDRLKVKYADDPSAQAVLTDCQVEIDYYRRYPNCYGYLFLVMQSQRGAARPDP
jgi:SAM-dependent methyltransferase